MDARSPLSLNLWRSTADLVGIRTAHREYPLHDTGGRPRAAPGAAGTEGNDMSEQLRNLTSVELDRLNVLSTISQMLNASYDVDEVLQKVLDVVINTLGAQRGFVVLDRGDDEPDVAVARNLDKADIQADDFLYSRTLVRRVLETGDPIISRDVSADLDLSSNRSLTLIGTRSILCVPMSTRSNRIGVIYLDNQISSGVFVQSDLDLLRIIADLASAAIERARYFSHLMQSEKLSALGTLVAGITHELNSPLTVIMGFAGVLKTRLEKTSDDYDMVDRMHSEAVRCRNLVRQMLSLSRSGTEAPRKRTDLGQLVNACARLLRTDFRDANADLVVDVADGLPEVEINTDQWTQVCLNLLTNALHAVSDKPEDQRGRATVRLVGSREKLRLIIADNGSGIDRKILRRIFDPFFTTKPAGQGTGLGLSITHGIVTDHGGTISAANDPNGGAIFVIELPVAAPPAPPATPSVSAEP
ncbi:MAG: GAF domain-containing protein [Proteobacteria bacterium]|nr:GAF domain-containing protein [Pseudomonadota bacterium]